MGLAKVQEVQERIYVAENKERRHVQQRNQGVSKAQTTEVKSIWRGGRMRSMWSAQRSRHPLCAGLL